jgi:uncharacterized delta-60 repeat protein
MKKFGVMLLLTIRSLHATQGVSSAQIQAVAIQTDGTILAGGYMTLNNTTQYMTAHFSATGGVDGAYGTTGYCAVPFDNGAIAIANAMALLSNNEGVLAGYAELEAGTSFALAQISTAGVLDTTFNSSGSMPGTNATLIGEGCSGNAIALDANGNYLLAGVAVLSGSPQYALARYTSAGVLDSSFNQTGFVTTPINLTSEAFALTVQPNGQIVLGGFSIVNGVSNFCVARYNADSSLDTEFNASGAMPGTVTTPVGASAKIYGIALDANGAIVAAGTADSAFALARYTPAGVLDITFNSEGNFPGTVETVIGSNDQINAIALQSNGAIVVAGSSTNDAGTWFAIARYNSNGTLDTTFNSGGAMPGVATVAIGSYASAQAVTIDSSGNIVVGGTSDNNAILARFTTSGVLDTTFGSAGSGYVSFPNTSVAPDIYGLTDINIADQAGIQYSKLDLANAIMNSDINANAGIVDTKLATIQTPGTVLNAATTATASNVAGAIVARDALGNFSAGTITADVTGDVAGSASNNVLKAGDTMSGSLVLPAGSASNPSLQFTGNTNVGLSASSNGLTLSTNGRGAVSIDVNGAVTIATPEDSEVGLTLNGGGAALTGNVSVSENLTFNTGSATLNAVGSPQGSLVKLFWGTGNSGLNSSVTINYSAAGFSNAPQIYLTSTNGTVASLGANSVTTTSALVLSGSSLNVPFSYLAVGV